MTVCKNLTRSRIGHFALFCCFLAIAIYGMSIDTMTFGLFLVAGGCLQHAIEGGHAPAERFSALQKSTS